MAEVRARSPGKIIISGEHAVVHGSTAVAAAVDLHTHVSIRPSSTRLPGHVDGSVCLELKDMNLVFSWPLSRLRTSLGDSSTVSSSPVSCTSERMKLIAALVEEQSIPEAKISLASGISAFLHLYTSIHGYKPVEVVVFSDLPLGSGMGSSASFCVSLAAALLVLSDAIMIDKSQSGWLKLCNNDLELVNKWAFEGEKIIHGKPSGIDNTVSTFGSMIQFKLGEVTRIKSSAPLRMLITNTKVGRNTKALVASVSERSLRHQNAMASVFAAVDSISKELSAIIQSAVPDDISITEREEKIEELMEMNQGLLQCMGVSHASIETVLRTTLKYKLASKLTGAGGGGCVLTLLPTSLGGILTRNLHKGDDDTRNLVQVFEYLHKALSSTVIDKVIAELESCGFQCLRAEVGGEGLEICFS